MCPSASGRYDIQWRFSNLSPDDIEFRYQLFTGHVMECGDRSRGQVFASGRVKLRGGQEQQRYHGRKWLRQSGFDGSGFVLYLCLMRES